ncbi:thermostable hemolysin [Novosphingobium sp. BL-8H]|uniref:thermostable hemolysin n=1 Tax=Novosphingobium sp. BL-8H TaxID=3127640 RepID=UPI003756D827
MNDTAPAELVRRQYLAAHGAHVKPTYEHMMAKSRAGVVKAALGYRRAGEMPLFLERYLEAPIEQVLSDVLAQDVRRDSVLEIGNLAADDAMSLISLWGAVANDLGGQCEVAVATLTAGLRSMFVRIGVPLHFLAPAKICRVDDPAIWGRYYDCDPWVCAGIIEEGQRAISAFFARRRRAAL